MFESSSVDDNIFQVRYGAPTSAEKNITNGQLLRLLLDSTSFGKILGMPWLFRALSHAVSIERNNSLDLNHLLNSINLRCTLNVTVTFATVLILKKGSYLNILVSAKAVNKDEK